MIPVLGLCTMTRPDQLERLLLSIDHPVQHLVVIDNAAGRLKNVNDAWIRDRVYPAGFVKKTWYLRFPSNLGVPVSWNLIIKSTPSSPWWLIVNADAWFEPGSLARFDTEAGPDRLLLGGGHPAWCCLAVGERVVDRAGLIDEYFSPLYFEDNDWERRITLAGCDVTYSDIPVGHDNSSTIGAGYADQNQATFAANRDYYHRKWGGGPGAETSTRPRVTGGWSLSRRRELHWDPR